MASVSRLLHLRSLSEGSVPTSAGASHSAHQNSKMFLQIWRMLLNAAKDERVEGVCPNSECPGAYTFTPPFCSVLTTITGDGCNPLLPQHKSMMPKCTANPRGSHFARSIRMKRTPGLHQYVYCCSFASIWLTTLRSGENPPIPSTC